jgi:hypothetical protein
MKRFNINTCILLSLLMLAGCSKNFLNETPTAHQSTSNYYQTATDARRAVDAAYRMLRDQGFGGYSPTAFGDIMSDDAAKGGGGASDQGDIQQLKLFEAKSNNGYLENAWRDNYKGIYLANIVLANVPPINMDASDKAEILSEAYFLRGYYYLNLVRLFGRVPLIKEPLANDDYNKPQAEPAEIWASIIQDGDSALLHLPETVDKEQLGQATKGAAQSLLMEVYMWQKDWKNAQAIGDQLIQSGLYTLATDYTAIWTQAGEFGSGSILEVNNATIPGKGTGTLLNLFEASRSTWGYGFVCPTQDLVDAFEKKDPRLKATVIFNKEVMEPGDTANTSASETGYLNRKYWLPASEIPTNNGGGAGDGPTNDRIYTLDMIMLWDAEAAFHNGDIAHATDLVNQIRDRARHSGGNTDMTILLPYTAVTLDDIYHEQRVELALGQHRRFFDLVRTGRAATTLKGFKAGVNELLPIPLNELQLSGGVLTQNKGYQ